MADLTSSISLTSKSKLYGKFKLNAVSQNDLVSSLNVKMRQDLYSTLSLPSKGRMGVTFNIVEPPVYTVTGTSYQDAFVRTSQPLFNYGFGQDLYVGNDGNETYRTYLAFNVNSIVPTNKVVKSASLRLYYDSPKTLNQMMLMQSGTDWTEGGLTWQNQPSVLSFSQQFSIGTTGSYVDLDVSSLVKNAYSSDGYLSILLQAFDETSLSSIKLYSRESTTPPVLTIKYSDIPSNIVSTGVLAIPSSLVARGNVNSDLGSSIQLPFVIGTNDMQANLAIGSFISSSITVVNYQVNGNIFVTYPDKNNINSNIVVRSSGINALSSSIGINNLQIAASVYVRSTNDLVSSLDLRFTDVNNVTSQITLSNPNLSSTIDVYTTNDLGSSIFAVPSLNASINVQCANYLQSNIFIFGNNFSQLASSITIRQSASNDIPSSIMPTVSSSIGAFLDTTGWNHLQSSITPTYSNLFDANIFVNAPSLNGSIIIPPHDIKNIASNIVVRVNFAQDMVSSINVMAEGWYCFIM